MTKFDRDTALREIAPGRYEGKVSPDWRIVRGANGGHLAATVLRGMTMAVGDPARSPVSYTAHFARVPREDGVVVEAQVERSGRTMSTVAGRMVQDGKPVVFGIAAFTSERIGPEFSDISAPEVPGPDELPPVTDREDFPFGKQFDWRQVELKTDRAEIAVWMRLREPQPLDHFVLTQFCDAFAPAVFNKLGAGGGGAGVPTVEMTYHYREPLPLKDATPVDWYLGIFRTDHARAGVITEDGWLWTRSGVLVAQSRQLAILTS